jgi:hypothetical protein
MAGTRFAIHTIFFIEIVALICFALYQIRDVLLVDRVVSTASLRLFAGSIVRPFNSEGQALFPVSIRVVAVTQALFQDAFPGVFLDAENMKSKISSTFHSYFEQKRDVRLQDINIRSDESLGSVVRTICFGNADEQVRQEYSELLFPKNIKFPTSEHIYSFALCPSLSLNQLEDTRKKVNYDILKLPYHDIIRIYLNMKEERSNSDLDATASAAYFFDLTALSPILDSIFFPSYVGYMKESAFLPPWFHLNFILMDQDLREGNNDQSPKQLQADLLRDFSSAVHQRFRPLSKQLESASLTKITLDVTTESFVSINDKNWDTFLMERRFSRTRNSRLLPFLSSFHGTPEPIHLQYILYITSDKKSSVMPSPLPICTDYPSEKAHANNISTTKSEFVHNSIESKQNLQGYGSIWTWHVQKNETLRSHTLMSAVVHSFQQNFLKEIGVKYVSDSSASIMSYDQLRSPSILYQYERYALQRFWFSRTLDYVLEKFYVLLQWLINNPQIPISSKVNTDSIILLYTMHSYVLSCIF